MSEPKKRKRRVADLILACTNSVGELLLLYLAMIVIGGLAFAYFEHRSLPDGLWWSVVTSTTTGYGDLSPATWQGRLVAAAIMLLSILFVLPLLIGYIASRMMENKDAFTHLEQEELKAQLRALQARLDELGR